MRFDGCLHGSSGFAVGGFVAVAAVLLGAWWVVAALLLGASWAVAAVLLGVSWAVAAVLFGDFMGYGGCAVGGLRGL